MTKNALLFEFLDSSIFLPLAATNKSKSPANGASSMSFALTREFMYSADWPICSCWSWFGFCRPFSTKIGRFISCKDAEFGWICCVAELASTGISPTCPTVPPVQEHQVPTKSPEHHRREQHSRHWLDLKGVTWDSNIWHQGEYKVWLNVE